MSWSSSAQATNLHRRGGRAFEQGVGNRQAWRQAHRDDRPDKRVLKLAQSLTRFGWARTVCPPRLSGDGNRSIIQFNVA